MRSMTGYGSVTGQAGNCRLTVEVRSVNQRFLDLNQRAKEYQGRAEVIFVGDSITQGWEGNGKDVWAKYYAPRQALHLGIGSDHTQHVLWRLDHSNLDGLKPKVAVVLIGVNNIPDPNNTPHHVLEAVTAVVQKLRQKLPQTKVLLLAIFPFRKDFCDQRAKALQVNQALGHHRHAIGQQVVDHFRIIGRIGLGALATAGLAEYDAILNGNACDIARFHPGG